MGQILEYSGLANKAQDVKGLIGAVSAKAQEAKQKKRNQIVPEKKPEINMENLVEEMKAKFGDPTKENINFKEELKVDNTFKERKAKKEGKIVEYQKQDKNQEREA